MHETLKTEFFYLRAKDKKSANEKYLQVALAAMFEAEAVGLTIGEVASYTATATSLYNTVVSER